MNYRIIFLMVVLMVATALSAGLEIKPDESEYSLSKEPRLEKMDSFLVAGIAVMDTMDPALMMGAWEKFFDVFAYIPTAIGNELYGVNFVTEDYNPEKDTGYGYMAATAISSEKELPEGLTVRKIPASEYLVFTHKGLLKYLSNTFEYIYGEYLPASKYKVLLSDALEIFGADFKDDSPDSIIEIWVPVKSGE